MSWFHDEVPKYIPTYVLEDPDPKLLNGALDIVEFDDEEPVDVTPDPSEHIPSDRGHGDPGGGIHCP